MLQDDRAYFKDFAASAKSSRVSLQDHYLAIQRSQRNDSYGVYHLEPHELTGIQFARKHISAGDSCLVMGGGAGGEAEWLLQHGVSAVTCLDISERLLEICERSLHIQTVRADMRNTGLPDQAYDVVITHRSLHHMFYPFETLEEFARVARKKVIIINEPVRSVLKSVVRHLRQSRVISAANIYEYQFDQDDVHRYMAFNGFLVVAAIRYWETTHGSAANRLLNVLPYWGNRFTAVYQRME